ncbi:MAG: DUF4385 family protein [Haloarcula sp.]
MLPDWTLKNSEDATAAVEAIHNCYREYRDSGGFVGMDMARKFLQLGWTRAMRYAKYPPRCGSGRPGLRPDKAGPRQ